MYKRKIPLDLDCGISVAAEVVYSKWTYCILTEIEKGANRPKDLVEAIRGINKRVLQEQLKHLDTFGIISKTTYLEVPLRVEYALTDEGKKVLPILDQINKWGVHFSPKYQEIVRSLESSEEENDVVEIELKESI